MSFAKSRVIYTLFLVALVSFPAQAGPPFFTDDPEPVALGHHELYLFSTFDLNSATQAIQLPAIEYNRGILPQTQFHLIVPLTAFSTRNNSAYGPGDIEVGLKYRFIQETEQHAQVGIFPQIELPTGDTGRGLGNGQAWCKLPVWLQRSWGDWTSYGGGGYAINQAPGMNNYWYGGWLLQKNLDRNVTLGGELFAQQGSDVILNFGGYGALSENTSLLFTLGRTLSANDRYFGYLGFYWTW